mmetsp:Transcript_43267/g.94261  ORF Transcript_43267/g.94261 Transcript_43267/m.94261 type:complete len:205 (-) Transcript_43267:94-708(-)
MGMISVNLFLTRGARKKGRLAYYRRFAPGFKQWTMMKEMLNELVKYQRIETTLPRAKELQQYAEEIVFVAKKNTPYHDSVIESIVTSPEARRILYERLVPRYKDRAFHVTRVVNQWRYRLRDTAPMAYLEYVDRPGELRPANPVGAARVQHVAAEFLATRRGRRKHAGEMSRILSKPGTPPLDTSVADRCRVECQKYGLKALPE